MTRKGGSPDNNEIDGFWLLGGIGILLFWALVFNGVSKCSSYLKKDVEIKNPAPNKDGE